MVYIKLLLAWSLYQHCVSFQNTNIVDKFAQKSILGKYPKQKKLAGDLRNTQDCGPLDYSGKIMIMMKGGFSNQTPICVAVGQFRGRWLKIYIFFGKNVIFRNIYSKNF